MLAFIKRFERFLFYSKKVFAVGSFNFGRILLLHCCLQMSNGNISQVINKCDYNNWWDINYY